MKKDLENIFVKIDQEEDMVDLLADAGMIEHTLVNLVQNSIHAVSKCDDPVIHIRTYCLDRHICFEIEDNGCGIPKEHVKNIYEPSFTLKGSRDVAAVYKTEIKGSGYGMANVKKYVEQHNGKLAVESIEGLGTKVVISLAVIQKELSLEEKIEPQSEQSHVGKSILLVEDETVIADVQFRILTQNPSRHKVDIAGEGQAAISLFDANQYDLISLDYVLLDPMNGMEVYHHIRQTNKKIPILFVSGNLEFLKSIEDLKDKDPHLDHVSKPCKNRDYLSCINRLLTRSNYNV